ncbi:hypothetical protein OHA98_05255 [Streptomyces sp. NBC_00654]|uniref:hypothetical protein n=1 Tax=Streptomyces sp. NBC_00654 TaxID=2975799 RepID=UPI0022536FFE|nr:hypothetical protein [Streptomyces sp. NBC_00654]MCX4964231.1 hypothetical protein [Streptomyces sp. NBC_00654]
MTRPFAHLPVRLALTAGAAALLIRQYARRITRALTPQPPRPQPLFTELRRIETDPAYRALFLAGLDAAIHRRDAERTAELHAVEAAGDLLRHLTHPDPSPSLAERNTAAAAAATGTTYIAEIAMTTGATPHPVPLGRTTAPNRRLALRWLRTQALRLADAHGQPIPPGTTPWTHTSNDVRPVTFHSTHAPTALRTWATTDQHQAHALHHLETRPHTPLLTVTDPATGLHLHLTGRPARPPRAARQLKEEPCLS